LIGGLLSYFITLVFQEGTLFRTKQGFSISCLAQGHMRPNAVMKVYYRIGLERIILAAGFGGFEKTNGN